jgi:D-ribulokinase
MPVRPQRAAPLLNQADWLTALLSGQAVSDYHNALKMGVDLATGAMAGLGGRSIDILPIAGQTRPGHRPDRPAAGRELGINPDCLVRAGTTDSIAAFPRRQRCGQTPPAGDAVTSLGSTLVLKLLSKPRRCRRIRHLLALVRRQWLAGGASNAGGAVLRQHFSDDELIALSAKSTRNSQRPGLLPVARARRTVSLQRPRAPALPGTASGKPGRIPARHPGRPGQDRSARLRQTRRTRRHRLRSVVSAGGGAKNPAYTRIRARLLQVPVSQASQDEACYGSARLARHGRSCFQENTMPEGLACALPHAADLAGSAHLIRNTPPSLREAALLLTALNQIESSHEAEAGSPENRRLDRIEAKLDLTLAPARLKRAFQPRKTRKNTKSQ